VDTDRCIVVTPDSDLTTLKKGRKNTKSQKDVYSFPMSYTIIRFVDYWQLINVLTKDPP
jgi:hypothetical protein